MTTHSEIIDQINTALDDAFRKVEKLQQELFYKIDGNIIKNLGGQIEFNKKCSTLKHLIDELDRKGFLDELVIAAIRANPQNSKLVDLRRNYRMDDISPVVKNQEFSQEFDILWSIICTINKDIIISECLKILSSFDLLPQEKSELENKFNDLKSIEEIFNYVLKKFLLVERKKLSDGTRTVLRFAQYLADNTDVEDSVKQRIENWILQIRNKYGLPTISISYDAQPYLLVIISPEGNSFRVYAYLIPDHQKPQNMELIEYESDGIALEAGIKLDSFHEIKNKLINSFIKKSEDMLLRLKINQELIIEFFLPIQYLYEKIEQWELLDDSENDDGWDNDERILGNEYGVVVRSYDLFQNFKLRKALRKLNYNRERFNLLLLSKNDEIQAAIHHINELDCYCDNWDKLRFQLEKKIGLNLICPVPQNDEIRQKLFQSIISSGIIMIIWKTPNTSGSSSIDENYEFLNLNSLTNLNNLFINVKEKRRENHDIFLLCEEPHLDKLPLCPELITLR